jgi:hypothetical protein
MTAKRALRSRALRIQNLDRLFVNLLCYLDALTQAACPGLRQSYEIGVHNPIILLRAAGDNPERLRSETSFAALFGASPLPASSGNIRRHRHNRGSNRQTSAALHRILWYSLLIAGNRGLPQTAQGERLSNKDILRCLKRFIAREVFHLLSGRPPLRTAAA